MPLGSIIGGIFSAFGQRSANKANLAIARENRAFQREMSNTAVRRRMRDCWIVTGKQKIYHQ